MRAPGADWRLAKQADWPVMRTLLGPQELHATTLSERVRTPAPLKDTHDRLLVHTANGTRIDAILFLSDGGCAMPLVDTGLELDQVRMIMTRLRSSGSLRTFKPVSCVGLESTTRLLVEEAGWLPALSVRYDAMSLDAKHFRYYPAPAVEVTTGADLLSSRLKYSSRFAAPADLEELMPVARAYEHGEVVTPMHPFNEAVCRANQARSLARYRVRIIESDGKIVARAQTNAVGYWREQLGGILVLPELRGKGLGRLVVADLIMAILESGKGVSLFVKKANAPARELYLSLGFRFSGDFRVDYFE